MKRGRRGRNDGRGDRSGAVRFGGGSSVGREAQVAVGNAHGGVLWAGGGSTARVLEWCEGEAKSVMGGGAVSLELLV